MNSSELTQEIEKRLKWELVLKSNTAAPVVVILGLGIAYFRFGVAYYADALSILAILCAFNAVVRFFIGRWGIQKKMDHQLVVKFVFYSMALNGFLWAVIFLIVFLQSPVTGLSYALAFMISITLMVASVVTLSYSRVLATCFQMGLLSGNVIVFAREYFVQNNNDYLWMLISLILLAFYFLRQTWDFHRQMFEKYRYEMELELSVKQLQESNLLLIEETARAENSSRLAALGDMAGGMAHEINTPLAIINLMAEETLGLVGSEGPVAGEMRTKLSACFRQPTESAALSNRYCRYRAGVKTLTGLLT